MLALKRFVDDHEPLPVDTSKLNVFITGGEGLIPADEKHTAWESLGVGALLGLRFDRWFPGLIKGARLRAIIAKGTTGAETRESCARYGCVQLMPFGLTVTPHFTDVLEGKIKDEEVYWREAGMSEALIVYHVGNTGPWIVNIDTDGNTLYDRIYDNMDGRIRDIYQKIGVAQDFKYSSLEE